jgi:hypothetical protein
MPEITQIKNAPDMRRQLPNELIEVIVDHIKEDGNFKTLATVGLASHNMYNIVIPKLYETVTVKKGNQDQVSYGHTSGELFLV